MASKHFATPHLHSSQLNPKNFQNRMVDINRIEPTVIGKKTKNRINRMDSVYLVNDGITCLHLTLTETLMPLSILRLFNTSSI